MARILLVDDEPRIVTFLEKGLKRQRHQAESAFNGREALDMALSQPFDLILLDLGLPVIDGFDVLSKLRETEQSLPVMIITARGELDCARAIQLGANDCIHKPFRFSELLPKLNSLLGEPVPSIADSVAGYSTWS
ncbi:MAG: response regulator transcription factor [Cyanobacteria bacterium J06636_28]